MQQARINNTTKAYGRKFDALSEISDRKINNKYSGNMIKSEISTIKL